MPALAIFCDRWLVEEGWGVMGSVISFLKSFAWAEASLLVALIVLAFVLHSLGQRGGVVGGFASKAASAARV